MSQEVLALSAAELVALFRAGELSPVDVTEAALGRIEQLDALYNAFVLVDQESALEAARQSERRWQQKRPLGVVDGLPTTVKDLILARGWPTRRGSKTIDPNQSWEEDGPPVARLREQGAVLLGKTTTPEFGWKGVTDSPLSGVTVNPWNRQLTPGGSSGGAAVAAAFGMGVLHVATDGGGSIRIPSGFSGLFGIKPTFGIVPVHPHSPALTLWHQGPIARTVSDAALVLTVIAQPDERDWYAVAPQHLDYRAGLNDGVQGLRIGYSPTLGYARVDPEVAAIVHNAVMRFETLGAHVEELALDLDDPIHIMQPLWAVALALAIEPMSEQQRQQLDQPIRELAEPGFSLSALQYRRLERERENFARRMNRLHRDYDLLITPQMPIVAFEAGHNVPPQSDLRHWWEWSPFTYPFNLSQQPAAAMPCGFTDAGLPVAMQIVGAKFADALVLRAARAFEQIQPIVLPSFDSAVDEK